MKVAGRDGTDGWFSNSLEAVTEEMILHCVKLSANIL